MSEEELERAREVAEAPGHACPPELRRAAPLSELVDGWPEEELRIERAHARIDEYKRTAQRIRDASHEPGKEPEEAERAARWDAKAAELDRRLTDESDKLDDFASPKLGEALGLSDEPVGVLAPTVRRNSTKTRRRNALDPIIDRLLGEAADPTDHAAVWVEVLALANRNLRPAPLLGIADGKLQYLGDDGEAAFIERKAFMQRLKNRTASDG